MKKVKNLSRIIALLLVLTLCLPFVFACGETNDTTETTDNANEENNASDNSEAPTDDAGSPQEDNTEPPTEEATEPPTEPEPEEDVPDSGTVKLLGKDSDTKGDWVGNYGSEGYVIAEEFDGLENLPAYAKYEFYDHSFWTWWDSDTGTPAHEEDEAIAAERELSSLFKNADKAARISACWYANPYFSLTISVGDTPKKVTLYMNDFDSVERSAEVITRNITGKAMKEPAETVFFDVGEYSGGCYVSYVVSGDIMFEFESFAGANVVLSGIFFDPAP